MPAYNAEKTLEQTYAEIPREIVDEVILTDDCSRDGTVEKARELGIKEVLIHPKNRGYGGNQKTCYNRALELGADIVIMLHPDYQYTPKLIEAMAVHSRRCCSPKLSVSKASKPASTKKAVPPEIR